MALAARPARQGDPRLAAGYRRRRAVGIPYEAAKAHLELARHLPLGAAERRSHAEAAAAIYAKLGAARGLERCEAISRGQAEGALPSATSPAS